MNEVFAAALIVPLLNQRDAWLEECLRSAASQTVPTEIIVVTSIHTNGSNLAILEAFAKSRASVVIARRAKEGYGGFPNALNTGIALARSSRIGFLLSDDWLSPQAVQMCVERSADIVSTARRCIAGDGTPLPHLDRRRTPEAFARITSRERQAAYLGHLLMFQKAALLRVGGLDETMGNAPGIDDYDLLWVLLERGASVDIVAEPLYCYRDHDQQRLTLKPLAEQTAGLHRILDKHQVTREEREQILARHVRWFGKPLYEVRPAPAAALSKLADA